MRMPLNYLGYIYCHYSCALLAFPALFVACIMMTLDNLLGTSFFMPEIFTMGEQLGTSGGSPILFQHLFLVFWSSRSLYRCSYPLLELCLILISVHARKNVFGYRMMVWAIVIIGALKLHVVWAHHMYVSGMNPYGLDSFLQLQH